MAERPEASEASGLDWGIGLDRALALAYRYLNRRERTVDEVRRHLKAKGIDPDVGELALEGLSEQGVLDDPRYARLFVQDKRELEQWGAERIRQALIARGVDRELVAEALAETGEGSGETASETELDRALGLLRRRFVAPPRERRERDRALGVLIRKGYDPELALDALAAFGHDRA